MKTKQELMSEYVLNDSQAEVVLDNSKELIVPAGAGSGKTKTLVTKVVEKLKQGNDLESFLVLTFTKKAAREMRERIKFELNKEGLDAMANKVDSAHISTFDAFAYNFVKQNASLVGLDTKIDLLEETLFSTIKRDILNDIIIKIMQGEKDNKYYQFLELYSDKTDENQLINDLFSVYYNLLEMGNLKELKIEDLSLFKGIFNKKAFKEEIEAISPVFAGEYSDYLNSIYQYLDYLAGKSNNNPIIVHPRISWKRLEIDENTKKAINKALKWIKELKKENIDRDVLKLYLEKELEYIEIIIDLLIIYEEKLTEFKQKTNKYEFHDIANFLNEILKNNEELLQRQKNKFLFVFVDEYQDTSKVQSDFLEMIIKDNNLVNVLYVGDIKQSIYKFRNAKPETFIKKQAEVKNISLNYNYRSSKPIIDFVNKLFSKILNDKDKLDIDYSENHAMISGSTKYDEDSYADVYLKEVFFPNGQIKKKNKFDTVEEAFLMGNKIKALIKAGKVKDYKDVAILARTKNTFKIISDVFEYLDIPLQIQVDQKLKQTYLLKLIANILKLSMIINSNNKKDFNDQRFFYLSIARSELFVKSDYNLFLDLIDVNDNFKKKLDISKEIKDKCLILNDYIETKSNYQIIEKTIELFEVYKKISQAPKRKEKEYQLDYLFEIATILADLDIYGKKFVNYVFDLAYDDEKEIFISILEDEEENSVKMTNIHQAKGLQYKILFVADLNRAFNKGIVKKFKFNNIVKFNINMKYKEENKPLETLSNYIKKEREKITYRDALKEELRLLYVALTRAEQSLYLFATPKENYEEMDSFTDYLYKNGVLNLIKPTNITKQRDSIQKHDYYTKLRDVNLFYPKEIDKLKEIQFKIAKEELDKSRASISINNLISKEVKDNLKSGTKLHLDFEYENTNNPLVKRFFETSFNNKNLLEAVIYHEYEFTFTDDEKQIRGIVDLIAVYEDEVHIIDYKLKYLDEEKYQDQLLTYKNYLKNIFAKPIKMFIYSIVDSNYIEIV